MYAAVDKPCTHPQPAIFGNCKKEKKLLYQEYNYLADGITNFKPQHTLSRRISHAEEVKSSTFMLDLVSCYANKKVPHKKLWRKRGKPSAKYYQKQMPNPYSIACSNKQLTY